VDWWLVIGGLVIGGLVIGGLVPFLRKGFGGYIVDG